MGCDIHIAVEGRNEEGVWICLNPVRAAYLEHPRQLIEYREARHYGFFASLCGVRAESVIGPPEPLVRPTGVFADSSDEVREWADNVDYHSVGGIWYPAYRKLVERCYNNPVIDPKARRYYSPVHGALAEMLDYGTGDAGLLAHDLRIVFAFDN